MAEKSYVLPRSREILHLVGDLVKRESVTGGWLISENLKEMAGYLTQLG